MKTYIACDPGKNGAWAAINADGIILEEMPIIGDRKDKNSVLGRIGIRQLLYPYNVNQTVVLIEKPICFGARPGKQTQGIASQCKAFKFQGEVVGIVSTMGFRLYEVHPKAWQAVMYKGEPKREKKKDTSAIVAQRLFPDIDFKRTPRCTKAHDGFTDAILIAEYGRRMNY